MQSQKTYIVDDEPAFLELMSNALADSYEVVTFSTGQSVLDKLSEFPPNIVLLDVSLPDINGFEVCKSIKKSDPNDTISVIFISGHYSLAERLAGYNAGADDYLVKPVDIEELRAKVNAVSKYRQEKECIREQEALSRNMAFQAMTEAAQYGAVLQFVKKSATCASNRDIALAIAAVCAEFSLNCTVQIRTDEVLTIRANGDECNPIEHQLFEMLSHQGRIYTFNKRYMFNDRHLSMLITNMPIEDESKSGHLNDLLATIVEAGETAIVSLARLSSLNNVLATTQSTLASVTNAFSDQKSETIATMDKMMIAMETALMNLGLTEAQEKFFIELGESTQDSLLKQFVKTREIEGKLRNMVESIQKRVEGSTQQ